MTTSFSILSAITVPENYSWDQGAPFSTPSVLLSSLADQSQGYILGYAPGVKVIFNNTSIDDLGFEYAGYTWDFNDYYNTTYSNTTLSCTKSVEHVYIMPGTYKVALKHYQTKTLSIQVDPGAPALSCLGKYNIEWYWDNLNAQGACRTWNETGSDGSYIKRWDDELACYGKYCSFWSWTQLESKGGTNPVTWEQSRTGQIYAKRWSYEPPTTICKSGEEATFVDVVQVQEETYTTPSFTVKVLEIPPTAHIHSITQPTTGYSPFTVQLTPRSTVCGSFPIDKIIWDPCDGSEIKTVTRYSTPDAAQFTYTNIFSSDPYDPRNYDLIHTYKRQIDTYPVFYPSLTAYCSCTYSSDSCSMVLGPVSLSSISGQTHLLKIRNTPHGNLYSMQVNNTVTFVTTQTANITATNFTPTIPQNVVKPATTKQANYLGNMGLNYPSITATFC